MLQIKAHHLLWTGQVLHRVLSLNNFKCYKAKPEDGWNAVIIDFELSSMLDGEDRNDTSKHRTGTTPYMAHSLLVEAPKGAIVDNAYYHKWNLDYIFFSTSFLATWM
jgi:hypothetical protein